MRYKRQELASLGDRELEKKLSAIVGELGTIRAANGHSLANVTGPDAERVAELNFNAEVIGEEIDVRRVRNGGDALFMHYDKMLHEPDPAAAVPLGRGGNGRGTIPGPAGWHAGHWANAFIPKIGAALTPSGTINVPSLLDGIKPLTERPFRLLDVMPRDRIDGTDRYAYIRETVRTLAAAAVAAGGTKPTSVLSVAKVEDRARVIAHVGEPVDRFILQDANLVRGYIEGSFRDGVFLALETQIVTGDGLGENLTGITNTSGIQTIAFATSLIITARKMATALENVDLPDVSAFYLINPAQWETIELATASGSGEFLLENAPVNIAQRRLWGRPVIVSRACPTTHFFLIDRASVTVLERETVQIDWATESSTLFETNQMKVRAEGRFGFAVMRPTGIVKAPTA